MREGDSFSRHTVLSACCLINNNDIVMCQRLLHWNSKNLDNSSSLNVACPKARISSKEAADLLLHTNGV